MKSIFLVILYFLSIKTYCNPYDGDVRVCHVSYLPNSKQIGRQDSVISVPVIQLPTSYTKNNAIVNIF